MTNDEFIKAISNCHGDPGKIAIVQADHLQGIMGNYQLNAISIQDIQHELADLIQRFAEHEANSDEMIQIAIRSRAAIRAQLVCLVELLTPPPELAPTT